MDIVVCFALFLAAMLFCLVKGFSLAWALLFALVLFFALGLRRGYGGLFGLRGTGRSHGAGGEDEADAFHDGSLGSRR